MLRSDNVVLNEYYYYYHVWKKSMFLQLLAGIIQVFCCANNIKSISKIYMPLDVFHSLFVQTMYCLYDFFILNASVLWLNLSCVTHCDRNFAVIYNVCIK